MGYQLLLTPVLASFVDCISLCRTLKAQHYSLSLNVFFNPASTFHPPLPPPTPSHPLYTQFMNDYARYSSVTNMLNYLSWPTLEQRRNQIKLVLFFKIVHGIVDGSTLILTPLNTITRGHHCRYALPFSRTESYLNSFLPSTIRLWNKLPATLSEIDNINDFKKHLELYLYN